MWNRIIITLTVLTFGTACIEPLEAGVVGVRKVFRVPVDPIAIVPPEPNLDRLVGEPGMELILRTAGMTEPQIALVQASGASLLDLEAVNTIVPLDAHLDDVEASLVGALESELEARAAESLEGSELVTAFDTDWGAWDDWQLDLEDPNGCIETALRERPVSYRIEIEASSLDELIGSEAGALGDLELLESVTLREVGLRTLLPEEVPPPEPPGVELAAGAMKQLTDPGRIDHCVEGQPIIEQALAARITVASIADPDHGGLLAEVDEVDSRSECGFLLQSDDRVNLKPYFFEGFRLTVEITLAPGSTAFDLGGYVMPAVEGRFRIPSTLLEL